MFCRDVLQSIYMFFFCNFVVEDGKTCCLCWGWRDYDFEQHFIGVGTAIVTSSCCQVDGTQWLTIIDYYTISWSWTNIAPSEWLTYPKKRTPKRSVFFCKPQNKLWHWGYLRIIKATAPCLEQKLSLLTPLRFHNVSCLQLHLRLDRTSNGFTWLVLDMRYNFTRHLHVAWDRKSVV